MKLKKICNDLNLNMDDKYYIIVLACFSLLITIMMVKFHQSRGAFNSDIYVYLASALDYAGMNYGHISDLSYMSNSPLICYLTSLLFRMGFVSINSIFLVTSIFSIAGIFAMYVFLKIRFSNLLSLVGSLLYSSFSLTLFYFANGMLDVPAVAMILWTLIFTVAAVNKNPKYYFLVSLFFLMSFFTRYTTFYIVILIFLYIFKKYDVIDLLVCLIYDRNLFKQRIQSFFRSYEFKCMIISLMFGLAIFMYVFYLILSYNAPILYFNGAMSSINRFHSPSNPNFVIDKFFYIKNYLSLLFANEITSPKQIEKFRNPSVMAYLMFAILFCGFLIKFINIIKNKDFYKCNVEMMPSKTLISSNILVAFIIALFVIAVISFKFNYLFSVFFLWLALIIFQYFMKRYPSVNMDNISLSVMSFGLFSFYIIIFSFLHIKCVRYILPTFPAFTYFVIYALENILNFIKYDWDTPEYLKDRDIKNIKSDYRLRLSQIIPIIMIIFLLFTAFNFTNTVEVDDLSLNFDSAAKFFIDYDPDYQSKEIGVFSVDRYYEWYFQKDIDLINPSDFNSSDYDYVFVYNDLDNDDYHEIHRDGIIRIYERNNVTYGEI